MSHRGLIMATLLMLGLGVYFIANHHPREQADGLTISTEVDSPNVNNEK
jgi:hypothetical protein